jgi:hypothetical protein
VCGKTFYGVLLKLFSFLITFLRKSISTIQEAPTMRLKKLLYRTPVGANTVLSNNAPNSDFLMAFFTKINYSIVDSNISLRKITVASLDRSSLDSIVK